MVLEKSIFVHVRITYMSKYSYNDTIWVSSAIVIVICISVVERSQAIDVPSSMYN
jgi:hypothetical protein